MAKQTFDHTEFTQGRLNQHKSVGWDNQITLSQGPRSLWLMQAMHVKHNDNTRGIKLQLEHYDKNSNKGLFSQPDIKFSLDEEAVKLLFDYLQKQQSLEGINLGSDYISIPLKGSVTGLTKNQQGALSNLIANMFNEENLTKLIDQGSLSNEALNHINIVSQHIKYRKAVEELEALLESKDDEQTYQDWFKEHPWVFGIHYIRCIDPRRIGFHEIADILLETVDGYLDVFELKRPDMQVLRKDGAHELCFFSKDTSAAIAQCAKYMQRVDENRTHLKYNEHMPFLKPRARIIIGRSNDWEDDKKDALRTLNASLHYIEVLTYDNVLAMAQRMIDQYECG